MLQSQAARVQKTFRQSSQTYDLIFEQLCVEPGVGLNDPQICHQTVRARRER